MFLYLESSERVFLCLGKNWQSVGGMFLCLGVALPWWSVGADTSAQEAVVSPPPRCHAMRIAHYQHLVSTHSTLNRLCIVQAGVLEELNTTLKSCVSWQS